MKKENNTPQLIKHKGWYDATIYWNHRTIICREETRRNAQQAIRKFNDLRPYGTRIEANGVNVLLFLLEDYINSRGKRKVRTVEANGQAQVYLTFTITNLEAILGKNYRTCWKWLHRLSEVGIMPAYNTAFQWDEKKPIMINSMEVEIPMQFVHFKYITEPHIVGKPEDKRKSTPPPMHPETKKKLIREGHLVDRVQKPLCTF